MGIIIFILVGVYMFWAMRCARTIVEQEEAKINKFISTKESAQLKHSQKQKDFQNNRRHHQDEAIEIFTLYEITKAIATSTNEQEAFEIFKRQLTEHVHFYSCQFVHPDYPGLQEIKQSTELFVFPVQGKKRIIGFLVFSGILAEEKEKVLILCHQFSLALRRVDLYQEIERVAITDSLTDVHTRRYVLERLQEEMNRSRVKKINLSFLMIDVDLFKNLNDAHGHLTGDQILQEVGKIIKDNIREIDIAGRYGGEEFCIVLPDTDYKGARYVAERIRKETEEATMKVYDAAIKITVSIGIANFPQDGLRMEEIIDKADMALYEAKKNGRNRIYCFSDDR